MATFPLPVPPWARCSRCLSAQIGPGSLLCPACQKAQTALPNEIVAAPIEGWRIWKAERAAMVPAGHVAALLDLAPEHRRETIRQLVNPQLLSVSFVARVWLPDMPAAICLRHALGLEGPSGHEAPHRLCRCGYWAFKTEADLWQPLVQYHATVYGRVQMWGRIIECEHGWRAQYARPVELNLIGEDEALAVDLAEAYGVPVARVWPEPEPLQAAREASARALERAAAYTAGLGLSGFGYGGLASGTALSGPPAGALPITFGVPRRSLLQRWTDRAIIFPIFISLFLAIWLPLLFFTRWGR